MCRRASRTVQWAAQQLARAHDRLANIRKNTLPQAAGWLAKTKSAIVLEDLPVGGRLNNHHLAPAMANVGLYEFRRPMRGKGGWYGCAAPIADRDYPSSKRCSGCAQVKPKLPRNERVYRGECGGLVIDRHLIAALNLEQLLGA